VKDKVVKALARQFKRAGAEVAQIEVPQKLFRSSGVTYKEIHIVFADSQTVVLQVKQTGDIFQALLNKKVLPIKQQDNHVAAITEIVKTMEIGRSKFQKALALIRVKLPPGIKTAAPKMLEALTKKRDDAKSALAEAEGRISAMQSELTILNTPIVA
jgi:energy-converting hydrogenase A subunit M